jgi:hypothetical protein
MLAIAVLVVGGFAFQWGNPHLSPSSLPNAVQRQPTSTVAVAGTSPAPTSQPSPQPTPPRVRPTPPPATPGTSPTPSADVFALAPTSSSQTCQTSGAKLSGMTITLDNTGGQSSVTWQVQITQMDARGVIWASGTPLSGTIPAGSTSTLQVTPEKHLCMGFQSTTSFRATITYQTSTGSGMLYFTDVIMSSGASGLG